MFAGQPEGNTDTAVARLALVFGNLIRNRRMPLWYLLNQ
jgi:hypothetical protein